MTATTTPSAASRPSVPYAGGRLPYVPALDSLRAIAVIGVLAYHHDPEGVPGGWLGVSMFFTLSGFLIAGMLIAEHDRSGRVDLRAFWSRRIRRLLPASLVAIGMAFVVLVVDAAQSASGVLPDLRAAALNIANWHFVAQDAPYAGAEGVPSPVQHYWSLAIEEQFYLVFPVVAAVALRRKLLPLVVGAVLLASLVLQVVLSGDVDRAYFGTDTRAAELAAGVGLALAMPGLGRLVSERHRWVDGWGVVALAATVSLFLVAELTGDLVGSGGLTAVTVVWVGLLVASVCGQTFPRILALGPLPPLGRISYGIYLYHWPVYLLATTNRIPLEGPALLAFRMAATVSLAALSNALIELPARRRALPIRPVASMAFASVAAIVALTLVLPSDGPPSDGDHLDLAATLVAPPTTASEVTVPSTPTVSPTAPATTVAGHGTTSAADAPIPASPAVVAERPARLPRLLVVGDSTAGVTGAALQKVGASDALAEVHVLYEPGCVLHEFDEAKVRDGFLYDPRCEDIVGEALKAIPAIDPDAVVVFIGSSQLYDARYDGSDEYLSFLDPSVLTGYRAAVSRSLARLTATGRPVLWADLPTPAYDLEVFGEMLGGPMPGSGEVTSNDPARAAMLNLIDAETIDSFPGAIHWGYTAAITSPDGSIDTDVRPDGLHLDPEHAERLARSAFFPALEIAYRTVDERAGGSRGHRSPTRWSAR